jgi:hypothetical protein
VVLTAIGLLVGRVPTPYRVVFTRMPRALFAHAMMVGVLDRSMGNFTWVFGHTGRHNVQSGTFHLVLPFATRKQTGGCGPSVEAEGPRSYASDAASRHSAANPRGVCGGEAARARRASGEVEPVRVRRWTRGGQGRPRGRETEVGEDLGDDGWILDGGEEAEATAAAGTREDVNGENSLHQVGPRPGTAGPFGGRRRS